MGDETLFGGSARYYRAGRLPYPAELAAAFQDELGLDGSGRLIDVGCGTGEIALLLAPLFNDVVGLDADADMVTAARAEARRQGAGIRRGSTPAPRTSRPIWGSSGPRRSPSPSIGWSVSE